jgi:protein-disulfide isomerase
MASRKEQKEQARARRLAAEQARAARERQRRRLGMIGGVVLVAVAVVAVAIAISSGGSSGQSNKQLAQTGTQVSQLLTGIPQSGATLGNPSAKVTMTYFGDLECPICRDFTLNGGFPQLIQNDVRSGKVKVVYKSFCTATCSSAGQSVFNTQQVAAMAAGKQNRFWDYTELFYRDQGAEGSGYVTQAYLDKLAHNTVGLDFNAWSNARNDSGLLAQVQADGQSATSQAITGTPTLIFQGPKGKAQPSSSVPTYSDLQQAIKQVS